MDWGQILNFIYGAAYFLSLFFIFIVISIIKGRQAIINITIGLYLALLLSMEFPFYDKVLGSLEGAMSVASAKIVFFLALTVLTTILCNRIMPDEFTEEKFESFGKKLLLAFGATILVSVFSFQVLPVSEIFNIGGSITPFFLPETYYFWWLLAPLVILYIV